MGDLHGIDRRASSLVVEGMFVLDRQIVREQYDDPHHVSGKLFFDETSLSRSEI